MSSSDVAGSNPKLMTFWSKRTVLHDWYATGGTYHAIDNGGDTQQGSGLWFCRPTRAVQRQAAYRFVGGAAFAVLGIVGVMYLVGEFRAGNLETWKAVVALVCLLVAVPIFLESLLINVLDAQFLGRSMKLIALDQSGSFQTGFGVRGSPSDVNHARSLDGMSFLCWHPRAGDTEVPMQCDIESENRGTRGPVSVMRFGKVEFPWRVHGGQNIDELMPEALAAQMSSISADAESYVPARQDRNHIERWLAEYHSGMQHSARTNETGY